MPSDVETEGTERWFWNWLSDEKKMMNCLIDFSVERELPRLSSVESETKIASKSTVGSKQ